MSTSALKNAMRSKMRRILQAMSQTERNQQSISIRENLFRLDEWKRAKNVSIYISTEFEPDTTSIIHEVLTNQSKRIFVPRYDENSRHMDMIEVNSVKEFEAFPVTKWNIRQPSLNTTSHDAITDGVCFDVMIIPAMAFSKDGARLGHGKGYYDSYLDRYKNSICPSNNLITIGLAFRQQVVESVPQDDHDLVVDMLIYP